MEIAVVAIVALAFAVAIALVRVRRLRREIDGELYPRVRQLSDERAELERELAAVRERADTIAVITDNMSEGTVLIGDSGTVLSANKSALRILGASEAAVGRNVLELLRDVEFLEHIRLALSGVRSEMELPRSERVYRVFFSPVPSLGALTLLLDVTERQMSEALRREFSANVSHELKTPLTIIYGNAEMLCGGIVREDDRPSFYEKIKDESARMIALVDDIMLISQLDEGRGREAVEEVDIAAAASEAATALGSKAEELGVSISVDGAAALAANRSMMYELIYNLADNAVKYNRRGGSVAIRLSRTESRVRISVSDTGIGIPQAAQSRVFERFYRADKSRSNNIRGTGLGLAIVKHIAALYGGEIELRSLEGDGTEITVEFPLS
ncbi:MAG: PAS domain S-box protein [Oscillospiraceae bacterium]|jgi:two-component system phosphate regulon sensor histidine kinase PhoR|nr:PAS domain S-box protein [Oscillospiraceae bacterium]